MDRLASLCRMRVLFALLTMVLPAAGCASTLATAMYVIKGTNVDAEFDGLKEKRVAVICRPLVSLQYRNVGDDIAARVGQLLADNVRKIQVVDPQEVARWTDENTWEEYTEIGQALNADMVVGIDLEDFGLYQGQTLYQGRANVQIRVYDMSSGGKLVYEKIPPPSVYPPNTGVPTSEKQEAQFHRQYLAVLADEIARHFYSHDSRVQFAADSDAF